MDDRWLIPLIVVAFLVVFPLMWIGVVSLLGMMSGWRGMAGSYPAVADPTAQRFTMGSASIGWRGFPVSYRHILTVDVGEAGIGLSVPRMFGFMHPPLTIPWSAVQSCRRGFYAFWMGVEVQLDAGRVVLRGRPADAVMAAWEARTATPAATV